jgi:hypothetical protein
LIQNIRTPETVADRNPLYRANVAVLGIALGPANDVAVGLRAHRTVVRSTRSGSPAFKLAAGVVSVADKHTAIMDAVDMLISRTGAGWIWYFRSRGARRLTLTQ